MDLELNPHEARVLGVLIEKALTTPEQYPLSLNATTNGCNQKSNRDPVVDFSEAEVTVGLQGLLHKHLAGSGYPAGGRVEKHHHNAREHLSLDEHGLAVLAELLLRGPQAPGALRTRASRMQRFEGLEQLGRTLESLQAAGMVRRLPPAPGSRAERYVQLLAPDLHLGEDLVPDPPRPASLAPAALAAATLAPAAAPAPIPGQGAATPLETRLTALETEVASLRRALAGLAEQLGEPLSD